MSRRARLTIAIAVASISAIGIVVLAVGLLSRGTDRAALPLGLRKGPAVAPFTGYDETRVEINGRCRRVVVADTELAREQGLRGRADLGPYAGMLFVNTDDATNAYTMSGVSDPLEISWFAANGMRIGGAHMAPCPNHDQANCPIYSSPGNSRVALETPGGSPVTELARGLRIAVVRGGPDALVSPRV